MIFITWGVGSLVGTGVLARPPKSLGPPLLQAVCWLHAVAPLELSERLYNFDQQIDTVRMQRVDASYH